MSTNGVDRRPTVTFAIPSGKEGAHGKAVRLLCQGRVAIQLLHRTQLYAHVRGDSGTTYAVTWTQGEWCCTCPAQASRCAHVRAVQLCVDLSHTEYR